jgi:hypothetical protein
MPNSNLKGAASIGGVTAWHRSAQSVCDAAPIAPDVMLNDVRAAPSPEEPNLAQLKMENLELRHRAVELALAIQALEEQIERGERLPRLRAFRGTKADG